MLRGIRTTAFTNFGLISWHFVCYLAKLFTIIGIHDNFYILHFWRNNILPLSHSMKELNGQTDLRKQTCLRNHQLNFSKLKPPMLGRFTGTVILLKRILDCPLLIYYACQILMRANIFIHGNYFKKYKNQLITKLTLHVKDLVIAKRSCKSC